MNNKVEYDNKDVFQPDVANSAVHIGQKLINGKTVKRFIGNITICTPTNINV